MKKFFILFFLILLIACTQESAEIINKNNTVFKPNYSENYIESPDGKMIRNLRGKNDSDKAQEISIIKSQNSNKDMGVYIVKENDNLSSIALKNNSTVEAIAEINNLSKPYNIKVGQKLYLSKNNNEKNNIENKEEIKDEIVLYKVKSGDNLINIAKNNNTTTTKIIELNNLKKPYIIKIGQKLKIQKGIKVKNDNYNNFYIVKSGDNLINIAKNNNTTTAKIIELNNLKKPYIVKIGQKLKISDYQPNNLVVNDKKSDKQNKIENNIKIVKNEEKKQVVEKKSSSAFVWPIKGNVISYFGNKSSGLYNDGINISAKLGADFVSTRDGVIAYVGNELRGYGTIILIKHDSNWISAYAHCSSVKVSRGDKVKKGQVIGTIGKTGNVSEPQLYFSLRKGREAVDPLKYLPNI